MIRKAKVCLIGATAVGKSSLVRRYVSSIFSETYRTTIGVKIETRTTRRGDAELEMVIWDISGEDEFQNVQPTYLRGASGYLVVIDGTRRETLDVGTMLDVRVRGVVGATPCVAVLNKADLVANWELTPADVERLRTRGCSVVRTSAKTGEGVEDAFGMLADAILGGHSCHP